ncbi:hypothetical protein [Sessilibacter corallicola]|uniref:Uncharacterized protein n=1 Tax=Sessilibacter corallicola TaxID=2904075 RepID=A0ABQ0A625_9GAMM
MLNQGLGSVFSKLFVVCALIGLAGCETGYFWSVESLGFKRQDIFINSTGNLRDELRSSEKLLRQFSEPNTTSRTDAKALVSQLGAQVSMLKKQNRTFKRRGNIWLSTLERKGGFQAVNGFGLAELTHSVEGLQMRSRETIESVEALRKSAKKAMKTDFSGFSSDFVQSVNQQIDELQRLEKSIHELSFTIESQTRANS